MITSITKASSNVLSQVADLIVGNSAYLKDVFPECLSREELLTALKKSHEPWSALVTDRAAAFFSLNISDVDAAIDELLIADNISFDTLVPSLRSEFQRRKIQSLTLNAPEEIAEELTRNGFEKRGLLIRLAGPVLETELMPILPLSNPTERDIPMLAKLMCESYEKSQEPKPTRLPSAEKQLRDIMAGIHGTYLPEASLMSGAVHNIVSACFVTLTSPQEAKVAQLYSHPLYRARGLATTEIATSMNRLVKRSVQSLTVWVGEKNEVARRLFTKLDFKEDRRVVEMVTRIL